MSNEVLFHLGLVVAGISIVSGIVASVILRCRWKRLNAKLADEYGEKRR